MMNLINRDLWIISKADNKGAPYDEGWLLTLKVNHIEEDVKDQVGNYFIGEDMYLDPGFFTALGALANWELNANNLWLIQIEEESQALERWEQGVLVWERALLTEQQGLE